MWILPQQVFNFSESFYAPPVVLVTVNHHYDSHNAHSVRPEVNALSTWADVSFFQTYGIVSTLFPHLTVTL